jgi:hypothetical protein
MVIGIANTTSRSKTRTKLKPEALQGRFREEEGLCTRHLYNSDKHIEFMRSAKKAADIKRTSRRIMRQRYRRESCWNINVQRYCMYMPAHLLALAQPHMDYSFMTQYEPRARTTGSAMCTAGGATPPFTCVGEHYTMTHLVLYHRGYTCMHAAL